jgi:hypothetical protein
MPGLFKAGIAQQVLPAYAGLHLSGYAARIQPCTDVRDAVSVTALALENEQTLFVLLSVDALGFAIDVADNIRIKIASAARESGDWKEIQICLAATHSHAAPASMDLRECGKMNPQWLEDASDIIVQTALESIQNLQPARLGASQTAVPGIALNRRKSTFVDDELTVCRVDREDGKPLAMIVNFACHPVVLTHENRSISADYPGEVRRALQAEFHIPVLFLTGAAGDINPVHRGENDELKQTAAPLIEATKVLLPQIGTSPKVLLRGASSRINLPLLNRPTREQLISIASADPLPAKRVWAEQALLAPSDANVTVPCAIQLWQIDSIALVAIGCELFASLGLRFKSTFKAQGIQSVLLATYANGNLGYVPDVAAYERGGYEVDNAHHYYAQPECVTPEAGEIIVDTMANLLWT